MYEKIEITPNNEIIAGIYQGTSDIHIESFFIEVSQNTETAVILIHLHDTLDKIWTSPSTLSFRKGMSLKFGVLAKFIDGNFADLSFYPEFNYRNLSYITSLEVNTTTNRIEYNKDGLLYPPKNELPKLLENII